MNSIMIIIFCLLFGTLCCDDKKDDEENRNEWNQLDPLIVSNFLEIDEGESAFGWTKRNGEYETEWSKKGRKYTLILTRYADQENKHKFVYNPFPRYVFKYGVRNYETRDIKLHEEKREGNVVYGQYALLEPDGAVRFVKYHADKPTGFKAKIKRISPNAHPNLLPHHIIGLYKNYRYNKFGRYGNYGMIDKNDDLSSESPSLLLHQMHGLYKNDVLNKLGRYASNGKIDKSDSQSSELLKILSRAPSNLLPDHVGGLYKNYIYDQLGRYGKHEEIIESDDQSSVR